MAGLRERQKKVRMEELAQQADMSVGTVYNYYATKGDILIAIVSMEVEEVLAAGERLLASPPRPVLNALVRLIDHYYDHSLKYLSKEMWRTAMATSIDAPQTPNGIKYNLLDERIKDQVQRLICVLQQRGDVTSDLDANVMGGLLFNVLNMLFIEFVKSDEMELGSLKATLHGQLEVLAQWMVPDSSTR
ncbi:MAG: TetR/AcrR family transcriptional regulator [Halomonas sp.]